MAYIAKVPVKNHVYLYECESYREDGKVKSKRTLIGKIDAKTEQPVYKEEYIERMRIAGTPIASNDEEKRFSVSDIKNSSIKEIGLIALFDRLANESGLIDALRKSNSRYCNELFTIAKHLAANGEPFMHCQEWVEKVEITEEIESMSSQNISKILAGLTNENIEGFYQEWARKRSEKEYLALDITSMSSYSELIEDVEWGYNRDGEELPQVNLCMLMGEVSRLPVYQTIYQGSLTDVSTLKTTMAKFNQIIDGQNVLAVMDKGFYSKKNIDDLLVEDKKFVIAVPFSNTFAKNQVEDCRNLIDDFSNNIVVGSDTLRAITKKRRWGNKYIYAHIFYNPIKAVTDREKLYKKVTEMLTKANEQPEKFKDNKVYTQYLDILLSDDGTYSVKVKNDAVSAAKKYSGWLLIISNSSRDAFEVINIYRAKDIVEKGFLKLKHSLDLARLRVHSDLAMHSKVFVCFLALVLLSNIHNVMADKGLYKVYTMKLLMKTLSKRRSQKIGEERIEYPITKEQREIYSAFGFDM
jgi:transposase